MYRQTASIQSSRTAITVVPILCLRSLLLSHRRICYHQLKERKNEEVCKLYGCFNLVFKWKKEKQTYKPTQRKTCWKKKKRKKWTKPETSIVLVESRKQKVSLVERLSWTGECDLDWNMVVVLVFFFLICSLWSPPLDLQIIT